MTRLADRLRAALDATPSAPLLTGDSGGPFNPDKQRVPAAVLIAVVDRSRPGVLLTQRTETLRHHPGQVAFPGGRIDPDDLDAASAAVREAEEEIALPRRAVQVIGTTDLYRTGTGYEITPVIGIVPPDLPLLPAEAEVAAVFEVPLDHLLDIANHVEAKTVWQGRQRRFYEIGWQDRRIWGATAGMIVNLSRRLQWPA